MEADARQSGSAADAPEFARDIVRAERRAVLKAAHIVGLAVGFSVFSAVCLLTAAQIEQIPPERVGKRQRAVARPGFHVVGVDDAPVGDNGGVVDDHAARAEVDGAPPESRAFAAAQSVGRGEHERRLAGGVERGGKENVDLRAVIDLSAEFMPLGQHHIIRRVARNDLKRDRVFQAFVHNGVEFYDGSGGKPLLIFQIDEILKIHGARRGERRAARIEKRTDMLLKGVAVAVHRVFAHLCFHLRQPVVHEIGKECSRFFRVAQPHQVLGMHDEMNVSVFLKNANVFHCETSIKMIGIQLKKTVRNLFYGKTT